MIFVLQDFCRNKGLLYGHREGAVGGRSSPAENPQQNLTRLFNRVLSGEYARAIVKLDEHGDVLFYNLAQRTGSDKSSQEKGGDLIVENYKNYDALAEVREVLAKCESYCPESYFEILHGDSGVVTVQNVLDACKGDVLMFSVDRSLDKTHKNMSTSSPDLISDKNEGDARPASVPVLAYVKQVKEANAATQSEFDDLFYNVSQAKNDTKFSIFDRAIQKISELESWDVQKTQKPNLVIVQDKIRVDQTKGLSDKAALLLGWLIEGYRIRENATNSSPEQLTSDLSGKTVEGIITYLQEQLDSIAEARKASLIEEGLAGKGDEKLSEGAGMSLKEYVKSFKDRNPIVVALQKDLSTVDNRYPTFQKLADYKVRGKKVFADGLKSEDDIRSMDLETCKKYLADVIFQIAKAEHYAQNPRLKASEESKVELDGKKVTLASSDEFIFAKKHLSQYRILAKLSDEIKGPKYNADSTIVELKKADYKEDSTNPRKSARKAPVGSGLFVQVSNPTADQLAMAVTLPRLIKIPGGQTVEAYIDEYNETAKPRTLASLYDFACRKERDSDFKLTMQAKSAEDLLKEINVLDKSIKELPVSFKVDNNKLDPWIGERGEPGKRGKNGVPKEVVTTIRAYFKNYDITPGTTGDYQEFIEAAYGKTVGEVVAMLEGEESKWKHKGPAVPRKPREGRQNLLPAAELARVEQGAVDTQRNNMETKLDHTTAPDTAIKAPASPVKDLDRPSDARGLTDEEYRKAFEFFEAHAGLGSVPPPIRASDAEAALDKKYQEDFDAFTARSGGDAPQSRNESVTKSIPVKQESAPAQAPLGETMSVMVDKIEQSFPRPSPESTEGELVALQSALIGLASRDKDQEKTLGMIASHLYHVRSKKEYVQENNMHMADWHDSLIWELYHSEGSAPQAGGKGVSAPQPSGKPADDLPDVEITDDIVRALKASRDSRRALDGTLETPPKMLRVTVGGVEKEFPMPTAESKKEDLENLCKALESIDKDTLTGEQKDILARVTTHMDYLGQIDYYTRNKNDIRNKDGKAVPEYIQLIRGLYVETVTSSDTMRVLVGAEWKEFPEPTAESSKKDLQGLRDALLDDEFRSSDQDNMLQRLQEHIDLLTLAESREASGNLRQAEYYRGLITKLYERPLDSFASTYVGLTGDLGDIPPMPSVNSPVSTGDAQPDPGAAPAVSPQLMRLKVYGNWKEFPEPTAESTKEELESLRFALIMVDNPTPEEEQMLQKVLRHISLLDAVVRSEASGNKPLAENYRRLILNVYSVKNNAGGTSVAGAITPPTPPVSAGDAQPGPDPVLETAPADGSTGEPVPPVNPPTRGLGLRNFLSYQKLSVLIQVGFRRPEGSPEAKEAVKKDPRDRKAWTLAGAVGALILVGAAALGIGQKIKSMQEQAADMPQGGPPAATAPASRPEAAAIAEPTQAEMKAVYAEALEGIGELPDTYKVVRGKMGYTPPQGIEVSETAFRIMVDGEDEDLTRYFAIGGGLDSLPVHPDRKAIMRDYYKDGEKRKQINHAVSTYSAELDKVPAADAVGYMNNQATGGVELKKIPMSIKGLTYKDFLTSTMRVRMVAEGMKMDVTPKASENLGAYRGRLLKAIKDKYNEEYPVDDEESEDEEPARAASAPTPASAATGAQAASTPPGAASATTGNGAVSDQRAAELRANVAKVQNAADSASPVSSATGGVPASAASAGAAASTTVTPSRGRPAPPQGLGQSSLQGFPDDGKLGESVNSLFNLTTDAYKDFTKTSPGTRRAYTEAEVEAFAALHPKLGTLYVRLANDNKDLNEIAANLITEAGKIFSSSQQVSSSGAPNYGTQTLAYGDTAYSGDLGNGIGKMPRPAMLPGVEYKNQA